MIPTRTSSLIGRWYLYPRSNRVIKSSGTVVSLSLLPGGSCSEMSDMIHAVESQHKGNGPSAVLYIPAVPLTPKTIEYVRDQKSFFLQGLPAPDFPGGVGESKFEGRGFESDILSEEGRSA